MSSFWLLSQILEMSELMTKIRKCNIELSFLCNINQLLPRVFTRVPSLSSVCCCDRSGFLARSWISSSRFTRICICTAVTFACVQALKLPAVPLKNMLMLCMRVCVSHCQTTQGTTGECWTTLWCSTAQRNRTAASTSVKRPTVTAAFWRTSTSWSWVGVAVAQAIRHAGSY